MEFVTWEGGASAAGCEVLVVPLLALGHVPQLAVDLLVHSAPLHRQGVVEDPAVEPLCSSGVYGRPEELSFACELFGGPGPVRLLQLRSKLRPNAIGAFCRRLAAWVRAAGVREVVVLGAWDSGWLEHPDVDGRTVKFRASEPAGAVLRDMGLLPLQWSGASDEPASMAATIMGRRTFADLLGRSLADTPAETTWLAMFCAEGENVPEAKLMCQVLCEYLKRRFKFEPPEKWIAPPSWKILLEDANPETMTQLYQ